MAGAGEVILQFDVAERFAGLNPGRFTLEELHFDHAY